MNKTVVYSPQYIDAPSRFTVLLEIRTVGLSELPAFQLATHRKPWEAVAAAAWAELSSYRGNALPLGANGEHNHEVALVKVEGPQQ